MTMRIALAVAARINGEGRHNLVSKGQPRADDR